MAHKEQITKTNAARLLDELGISYSIHESEVDLSDLSAVSMAKKIGADPLRVFKTLVARGDKTGVIMACLPGSGELDLKALAKASKKEYPVFIDENAILFDTIYVSAGHRGVQLELAPDDLLRACHGTYAAICRLPGDNNA